MTDLQVVFRDPSGALLNGLVFLGLVLVVAASLWSRSRALRVVAVVLVILVVKWREDAFYVIQRAVFDRKEALGGVSADFVRGLRLGCAYADASSLYSLGTSVLLGAMAVFGFKGSRDPASKSRDELR